MKDLLLKIIKVIVVLALAALAVCFSFGLVMMLGWPWWLGFFVLLALVGIIAGIFAIRRIRLRRREQLFVHQVIAQDEAARGRLPDTDKEAARQLQQRWKEAVEALRKSHLRKLGNPLYVLPWYMVIGESGSGKTTAIKSAELSSPFGQMDRTAGISGTRNCDWWFFDKAILIDTAGRYALPVDEGRDKDEWQKFLSLLAKFRKKEPLNGLVVTIAADKLAGQTAEELAADGLEIRRRMDELMRVIGAKCPVYVLVTKCDLIPGATQFCDSLPEEALKQAMGGLNHDLEPDPAKLVKQVFAAVSQRLHDLLLLICNQKTGNQIDPSLLVFPEALKSIHPKLSRFVESAFQQTPYQETPMLRGIFFSSGKQEGTPFSQLLGELGLIQEQQALPETEKGLFLHDFFSQILPADRYLFQPTQHSNQWRRLTRNLGLTAWLAVSLALCGLLSFAFIKNLATLRDASQAFSKPPVLQGELLNDVITMDRFRQAVAQINRRNSNWWIPRFGLNESLDVEEQLKAKYGNLFRKGFLADFDRRLAKRLTKLSAKTPGKTMGAYILHLARRINLLRAKLEGKDLLQLQAMPQPGFEADLLSTAVIAEVSTKLSDLYLYALAWQPGSEGVNEELTGLQTWLKHLVTLQNFNLRWIAAWADNDPDIEAVSAADFWKAESAAPAAFVSPSFTLAGKQKIEATLAEIETALPDPLVMASAKLQFNNWYRKTYVAAWEKFAGGFVKAWQKIDQRQRWQAALARLGTDQDPYLAALETIAHQLEVFKDWKKFPAWADFIYDLQSIKQASITVKAEKKKKPGLLGKATKKVKSKLSKAEKSLGIKSQPSMGIEDRFEAARAYLSFTEALVQLAKAAESSQVAFKMAQEIYQQDPAVGETPFFTARRQFNHLKTVMASSRKQKGTHFFNLLGGNLIFALEYINRETACNLQKAWETEVMVEIQDAAGQNLAQLLFGSGGFATKFLKTTAAPFISRSLSKGFYPKKIMGRQIPFEKGFFSFLSRGVRAARPVQGSYSVTIRTYPTDANAGARIQPHATVLELQCANGTRRLENLNYPKSKTFKWSPQNCGDVTFQIMVGNLVLIKQYTGSMGFARFLNDFKSGQRIFRPSDFPNEAPAMKRMGITSIKARYRFQGHKPVIRLLARSLGRVPLGIAKCWQQK